MDKCSIEVIFEECGWTYYKDEATWRLLNFKLSRVNIHKSVTMGSVDKLKEVIINKLTSHAELPLDPRIEATIERLRVRKKK